MKKWQLVFSIMLLMSNNTFAQETEDFGLDMNEPETVISAESQNINEEFAEEEIFSTSSAEDADISAPKVDGPVVLTEPEAVNEPEEKTLQTENLSTLVERLNLSAEQLDALKFISDENRLRQEQLEKSIELFKAQAREIEEKSIRDFEAILSAEQKEIFQQIWQQTESK
ncbi:MAG: hypothetical protein IJ099_00725 [Alphaproteobacteria bacterium]|nr:hypothetical protein [Alphaproteobacteria bacterium]